jgi:hypothetical protein
VGPRDGVCRDFAVVGYCDNGIECEKQHVRECPDFAEKGVCPNRLCKLPHVIRANRRRQPATSNPQGQAQAQLRAQAEQADASSSNSISQPSAKEEYNPSSLSVGGAVVSTGSETPGAAEEYISLTFEESDDDDDDEEEDEDSSEDDQDAEGPREEKGTVETYMD